MTNKIIDNIEIISNDIKILVILEHEIKYSLDLTDQFNKDVRKTCELLKGNYKEINQLVLKIDKNMYLSENELDSVVQLIEKLTTQLKSILNKLRNN